MKVVPKFNDDGAFTVMLSYTDIHSSLKHLSSIPKKFLDKYEFSKEKITDIYNINDRRNAIPFKVESFKDNVFNVLVPKNREKEFYSLFVFGTIFSDPGGEFDISICGTFPIIFFETKVKPIII